MKLVSRKSRALLLSATAISLVLSSAAHPQTAPNAGDTVAIPLAPNTEPEARQPDVTGFSLSLDGVAIAGDPQPPVSGELSAALLFLYFTGGRDRTMIWDIHWNGNQLC